MATERILDKFFKKRGVEWRKLARDHIADPTTTDAYRASRRERFLATIPRDTSFIYLDTNFWVKLRDVELNRNGDADWVSLHARLGSLAKERTISAVISTPQYFELMKQTDPVTRRATAGLMDRLGRGIAFRDPSALMQTQTCAFWRRHFNVKLPDAWLEPWDALGAILGIPFLNNDYLRGDQLDGFNKN